MAKMGRRTGREKDISKAFESGQVIPALHGVNLSIDAIIIEPIATLGSWEAPIGTPIMREGFMTDTGLLPSTQPFISK
jgi:hypothetical protein